MPDAPSLPYGSNDLESRATAEPSTGKLRCVVRGCRHWLHPPSRKPKHSGDVCPDHGIRVHSGGTFSYADYRKNLIADADYFERHIRRHPFKYEAHRFGQERSEDALTWNVFRSLQNARLLNRVVELCTGIRVDREPRLFLWGLELKADGVEPWDLLLRARERFESDLPVNRPKTEPDIAIHLPGVYLLLIEAKFCSPNGTYDRDKKTKLFDLTIDQFVQIYRDASLKILDFDAIARKDRVFYQLHRNMLFAEYMAALEGASTQAFHANLVRAIHADDSCEEFLGVIRPDHRHRFERITWEQIYSIAHDAGASCQDLCRYMAHKTQNLKPAFQIKLHH